MAGIAPVIPSPNRNPFTEDPLSATTTSSFAHTSSNANELNPTTAELSNSSHPLSSSAMSTPAREIPGSYPLESESKYQFQGSQHIPGDTTGQRNDNTVPLSDSDKDAKLKEQSFPGYEQLTKQTEIYGGHGIATEDRTIINGSHSLAPPKDNTANTGSGVIFGANPLSNTSAPPKSRSALDDGTYVKDERTIINKDSDNTADTGSGAVFGSSVPASFHQPPPKDNTADTGSGVIFGASAPANSGPTASNKNTENTGHGVIFGASQLKGPQTPLGEGIASVEPGNTFPAPPSAAKHKSLGTAASPAAIVTTHTPPPLSGMAKPDASLPTTEKEGAHAGERSGGAGALPGKLEEQGVGIVPDERGGKQEAKPAAPLDIKKEAGEKEEKPVEAKKSESRGHPKSNDPTPWKQASDVGLSNPLHACLTPRAKPFGSAGARWGGMELPQGAEDEEQRCEQESEQEPVAEGGAYDTDYHPAAMHPYDDKYVALPPEAKAKEATEEKAQEGDEHGGEKKKKASFMEKMKGEAKVLLGKVEGKPQKVEEGKKLKSGEA